MKKFLRWVVDQLKNSLGTPNKWLNGDKVGLSGDKLIPNGDNSKFCPNLTLLFSHL